MLAMLPGGAGTGMLLFGGAPLWDWLNGFARWMPPLGLIPYTTEMHFEDGLSQRVLPALEAAIVLAAFPFAYRQIRREYALSETEFSIARRATATGEAAISPWIPFVGQFTDEPAAVEAAIRTRTFLQGIDWRRAGLLEHWLSRLLSATPGPWMPDQFSDTGVQSPGGGYEAVISTTGGTIAQSLFYVGPTSFDDPPLAERFAAVGEFLTRTTEGVNDVVKNIILGGAKYSAAEAFRSVYRMEALKQQAAEQWARMDVLLLPTTGTIYTQQAVADDPVRLNSNLGFYTNFVNLMDLAAIAVPAGFRSDGLPLGVSLIGPALSDEALLLLAERYLGEDSHDGVAPGCVLLAVVGAHLTGQPLNRKLTTRGARLVTTCRTTQNYRLYALNNTTPAKPGLLRSPGFIGSGIEVEVWTMPVHRFGEFVAGVPAPLGIGTINLEDGSSVKGFICESAALPGAEEITRFGGWRNYLDHIMSFRQT